MYIHPSVFPSIHFLSVMFPSVFSLHFLPSIHPFFHPYIHPSLHSFLSKQKGLNRNVRDEKFDLKMLRNPELSSHWSSMLTGSSWLQLTRVSLAFIVSAALVECLISAFSLCVSAVWTDRMFKPHAVKMADLALCVRSGRWPGHQPQQPHVHVSFTSTPLNPSLKNNWSPVFIKIHLTQKKEKLATFIYLFIFLKMRRIGAFYFLVGLDNQSITIYISP